MKAIRLTVAITLVTASGILLGFAQPAFALKPDALLQIDLNRATVMEKIVTHWSSELPAAQIDSFKAKLSKLRADHLLAANLSGSFDGVLEIINAATIANHYANQSAAPLAAENAIAHGIKDGAGLERLEKALAGQLTSQLSSQHNSQLNLLNVSEKTDRADKTKAIGDPLQDLVYTPITPCNLMDTRSGVTPAPLIGGPALVAGYAVRNIQITGNCDVPAGALAVSAQFTAENIPSTGGVIFAGKSGAAGGSAVASWSAPVTYASGASVIPISTAGQMQLQSANVTQIKVDVNGYFMPANRNGDGLRVLTGASGFPNIVNGDNTNAIGNTGGQQRGVTVSGGFGNRGGTPDGSNGWYSTIGGGLGNKTGADDNSNGDYATVSGGQNNFVSGSGSTVGGGTSNTASGIKSTVAGGQFNTASAFSATVPGGSGNIASSAYSFAAGRTARADQPSCAVFNLWSTEVATACAGLPSIFRIAANNGLTVDFGTPDVAGNGSDWVFIGPLFSGKHIAAKNGAYLSSGGMWTNSSDRAKKEAFRNVDVQAILRKVVALPVTTWSYIAEGQATRRMGPMAQDFRKAFGLGMDDKSIGVVDADGVALAAIQGLNQKLDAESVKSKVKDAKLSAQRSEISALKARLKAIEKKLGL